MKDNVYVHVPSEQVSELRTALGHLSGPRSQKYCSDGCLRRYLEIRNWNVEKAKKMLEGTLKWRSIYKPEEILWHEVAAGSETGLLSRANFNDRAGRPVLIMRPGRQNTTSPENSIRLLVYLVEKTILNLPEGQEEITWLVDFTGWSLNTSVAMKTARDIVNILQNHYPRTLGFSLIYNTPKIFEAFWKILKYFIDQESIQRIKFVCPKNKESMELIQSLFDTENLPIEFGGSSATLDYNHKELSRLMNQEDVKTAALWGFSTKTCNVASCSGPGAV